MTDFINDIVGIVVIAAVVFSVLKAMFSPFIKAMKKQQEEQKRQKQTKPLRRKPQPTFAGDDFGDSHTERVEPQRVQLEHAISAQQQTQVMRDMFVGEQHKTPKATNQKIGLTEPETRSVEVELNDAEDFKKAFIYSEIINRKY